MVTLNALGRQILESIETQLIPWVSERPPFVLLNTPPKTLGDVKIIERPSEKLPSQRGTGLRMRVQSWPEENLNALGVPYMGCVVDGEGDIVTGTTTMMCRRLKIPGKRWVVTARQKTMFIAPPNLPLSSGDRPHWERPHPESAYSRMLWFQFHGNGVDCHFCTSEDGKHWSHPHYFIYGTEFLPLAQSLIREMMEMESQYQPLLYSNLNSLFHYMLRGLLLRPGEEGVKAVDLSSTVSPPGDSELIVQEAIDFISKNLNARPLTVEKIAQHLHFSARHLSRVFRRDTGMTVMEFVAKRRMEYACQLLLESQFNISKIGGTCGYKTASSFVKAFQRHFGCSPSSYRATRGEIVRPEQQMAFSDGKKQ